MPAQSAQVLAVACLCVLLNAGCDRGAELQILPNADSGTSNMDSVDSGTTQLSCVDVSHVDEQQRFELEVIGTGFDADEGRVIRVVATHGEPNYAVGEATIRDGEFDIDLPVALGDYTGLGLYVDRIRNEACDSADEVLWQFTTGPGSALGPAISMRNGRAVWEVTPNTLSIFEQAGPCNINGIFDLTVALPCAD
jgi:hypothetical protein